MASRKGIPNKPRQGLLARLQREYPNYHPILEMARLANDPNADEKDRFAANKEVAKYVTPQLKAVEHTGAGGDPIEIVVNVVPHATDTD